MESPLRPLIELETWVIGKERKILLFSKVLPIYGNPIKKEI